MVDLFQYLILFYHICISEHVTKTEIDWPKLAEWSSCPSVYEMQGSHSQVQVHPWPPRGHLSPMHGVGGSRQRSRNDLRPSRANQCVISMRSCIPPSFPAWLQHLL